jgi:GrpB-like predicted nucleotidyltransferase (UPF0157 family)
VSIDEPVVFSDYDPHWPAAYARESARLAAVLGPSVPIDHIGSTAVVGSRGKPIVDIQVVVPRHELADAAQRVEQLGYENFGDPAIRDRIYLRRRSGNERFNVQVIAADASLAGDNLALRAFLGAHPEELARYVAAKEALVATHPGLLAYSDAKAAVVRGLIERARSEAGSPP